MQTTPFLSKYGPWALVSGAAMGLGAEFARQLAARGQTPCFYPGAQNRLAMFITTRLMSRPAAVRLVGAEMRKRYEKGK